MLRIYILTIFTLSLIPIFAISPYNKSERLKPDWLANKYPEPSNSTFRYQITQSEGFDLDETRKKTFSQLITYLEQTNNVTVSGDVTKVSKSTNDRRGLSEVINSEYIYTYKIASETFRIVFRKIDEYWELVNTVGAKPVYRCYALYAVGNDEASKVRFDDITFTYKYGFKALWRSALVPGYGQMYKGHIVKGASILGGQVALVGGIIFSENMRVSYIRKTKETYDIKLIRQYADKADNFQTIRNICIGGAAALYVYNLIDAVASNGRKRTVVKENHLSFRPAITGEYNGIALTLDF